MIRIWSLGWRVSLSPKLTQTLRRKTPPKILIKTSIWILIIKSFVLCYSNIRNKPHVFQQKPRKRIILLSYFQTCRPMNSLSLPKAQCKRQWKAQHMHILAYKSTKLEYGKLDSKPYSQSTLVTRIFAYYGVSPFLPLSWRFLLLIKVELNPHCEDLK